MMNDRFSTELRQHLLATADERPAQERFAAIVDGVARTAQRPAALAWLTSLPRPSGPFSSAAVRAGLIALALIVATVAALALAGAPPRRSADLGAFEQVAGRILSGVWSNDLVAIDPNAPEATTHLEMGSDKVLALAWSGDGRELLFLRRDPTDQSLPYDSHLFILHADGTRSQVRPEPVGAAAISRDGSRVAYAIEGEGLYVVDAVGGQPVRIAVDGSSPTFSPDGTQIAYLSQPRSGCCAAQGRAHVWVVDADSTGAQEILANEPALDEGVFGLTWSPAGYRIALANTLEDHVAVYTFMPDGSDFRTVLTGAMNPFWSPDGSKLAFSDSAGLSIADADGSHIRWLGAGSSGPWHPRPSQRRSPSPGFSTFTSAMNGISIDHPSAWQVRPAAKPWGGRIAFDAPDVDIIFDPVFRQDLYLAVVSQPLSSTAPRAWVADHRDSPSLGVCSSGGGGGIGEGFQGNPAWFQHCATGVGSQIDGRIVIVATATRGYVIYLHLGTQVDPSYDEAWFDRVLETVDLRPEDAVNAP